MLPPVFGINPNGFSAQWSAESISNSFICLDSRRTGDGPAGYRCLDGVNGKIVSRPFCNWTKLKNEWMCFFVFIVMRTFCNDPQRGSCYQCNPYNQFPVFIFFCRSVIYTVFPRWLAKIYRKKEKILSLPWRRNCFFLVFPQPLVQLCLNLTCIILKYMSSIL